MCTLIILFGLRAVLCFESTVSLCPYFCYGSWSRGLGSFSTICIFFFECVFLSFFFWIVDEVASFLRLTVVLNSISCSYSELVVCDFSRFLVELPLVVSILSVSVRSSF